MGDVLQRIYDWYVCGSREFYKKNVDRLWQRRCLVAVSDDCGFLNMDPLPLGYTTLDTKLVEATRRTFDRVARRY